MYLDDFTIQAAAAEAGVDAISDPHFIGSTDDVSGRTADDGIAALERRQRAHQVQLGARQLKPLGGALQALFDSTAKPVRKQCKTSVCRAKKALGSLRCEAAARLAESLVLTPHQRLEGHQKTLVELIHALRLFQ